VSSERLGLARAAKRRGVVSLRQARKRAARVARGTRAVARESWARRYRLAYGAGLGLLPSRDELPALLNRRGLVGTGAEVGVRVGRYSELLLSRWQGRLLISIDPWLEAPADEYVDHSNVPQKLQEEFYERTRSRLAAFGARSEIWRATSAEAATRVGDGDLDFVYIDARHDYDSVLEDLELWFAKVRPGGIVAGHDYLDGERDGTIYGVRRAVDEFFHRRALPVHATRERPPRLRSWLVEVPSG
jgi:hypothetical protein